jgi:hypothetical protein
MLSATMLQQVRVPHHTNLASGQGPDWIPTVTRLGSDGQQKKSKKAKDGCAPLSTLQMMSGNAESPLR